MANPRMLGMRDIAYEDIPEYVRSDESGETYHREELRQLAGEWHGGQWSALYAFSSSGTVVPGLATEAVSAADKSADIIEIDKLRTLATLEPEDDDGPDF